MKHLLALFLVVTLAALPGTGRAQDEDGEGFLTRLLQDSLSGAGRTVDIQGFQGALSSTATLDRMTIADEDGIWLELSGAVLRWNRSALLRGRLEVEELSAETLTVNRLPKGDDTAKAEASGFAIPDLPVAVNVGEVSIATLELGEPVLGEAARFTFAGNAALDDERLATALSLRRLDRAGEITAQVDLQPDANQLVLEITAEEPENGIAARLLDLPGRPSVSLRVDGDGPLDDFTAQISLASDGQDRLAGTVTLTGQADGAQRFAADLGGDLTAVLLPQARDFLGDDIRLTANGQSGPDGLELTALDLRAAAVQLSGSFALAADGRPQRFALNGEIGAEDGSPVTLPFGDGPTLRQAVIAAQFDADQGEDVTATVTLADFVRPDVTVGIGELGLRGTIATSGTRAVDLNLNAALSQLVFTDPALQSAVGDEVTATTRIAWTEGEDVVLDRLDLQGSDYSAQVDATLTPGGGTSVVTAEGRAGITDLSRLAPLAGADLTGRADLGFTLSADLLGGSFAVTAQGSTTDLALGIEQLDPVIGGDAVLDLAVNRSQAGLEVETFSLTNDQIRLSASGLLADDAGRIEYDAQLANSGAFTGAEGGPLAIAGAVQRLSDGFEVTGFGGGRDLATGIAQADALLAGDTDLALRLTLSDRILLEEARISTPALSIEAGGELTTGARDVTVTGQLYDSGVVTGSKGGPLDLTIRAQQEGADTGVTLTGTGRDLATGIAQADALLIGETRLDVSLLLGERMLLRDATITNPALSVQAEGNLTDGARDLRASVTLNNSGAPLGASGGPVTVNLRAVQDGTAYVLDLDGEGRNIGTGQALADEVLRGTTTFAAAGRFDQGQLRLDSATVDGTSVTASASGLIADGATDLDFRARLASLSQVVAQAPAGPVTASGSVRQLDGGALALTIDADGPGGTVARVSGQVGLAGGAVDLDISGNGPLALANPYIAPQSITGTARFDLALSGQPGLSALSGQVSVSGGRASVPSAGLAVEAIGGTVSLAGGRAQTDLRATVNGGAIALSGPVTLSGSYPADLVATLTNVPIEKPGLLSTRANGRITVSGGLTGGGTVAGRIGLSDTELRIPSGGFGGVEAIPDMRHVNEGAASRATRSRAGLTDSDGASSGGSGGGNALRLNLRVEAENSMFLRGRGIDAELRGGLTLEGTTNDVRPVGQFDLVRGRIDILTKRLDLTEGRVRLAGGFDPIIRLVAESSSGEYVVQIVMDGPAAAPQVVFTSRPELPEDEVLSQLFFERDIASLSPLQAARLAVAIAELTGKGGGGVVGKIRDGAGLDDLDVSQTADGETALSAGKYISDNVYTEVEATSGGKTSLSINLDVTDNLTAKGQLGSDGDSSLGIFFERDY
ncbi:translocation/assembly module TamB domain-containing protein [Pseudooceanicola nitratireducens]|uniref:translocation/assembly module TamB domain-containing protein n=1 Tax=Pseudooceanicola nitratireducens TaxID=517719 RepID=UPI00351833B4